MWIYFVTLFFFKKTIQPNTQVLAYVSSQKELWWGIPFLLREAILERDKRNLLKWIIISGLKEFLNSRLQLPSSLFQFDVVFKGTVIVQILAV